jgi:hypothetical protein
VNRNRISQPEAGIGDRVKRCSSENQAPLPLRPGRQMRLNIGSRDRWDFDRFSVNKSRHFVGNLYTRGSLFKNSLRSPELLLPAAQMMIEYAPKVNRFQR